MKTLRWLRYSSLSVLAVILTACAPTTPDSLESNLNERIRRFSPDSDKANAWLVIYKYTDNYTRRCRTNAAVYPAGVEAKYASCAKIGDGVRRQFLDAHLKYKGVAVREGDPEVSENLQEVWDKYNLTSTANWPIYGPDGKLWGYAGLSFSGNTFNRMSSDRSHIVKELVDSKPAMLGIARPAAAEVEAFFRRNPDAAKIEFDYEAVPTD